MPIVTIALTSELLRTITGMVLYFVAVVKPCCGKI